MSWFYFDLSGSNDKNNSSSSGAQVSRRLEPKPHPPVKVFPEEPITDDVDKSYAVSSHGYSNSTEGASDGATKSGDGYDSNSSNRTDYVSGMLMSVTFATTFSACVGYANYYTQICTSYTYLLSTLPNFRQFLQ